MTRTKIFSASLALALLLTVSLSGPSFAETRPDRPGGPEMGYTPEQQAEMQAMRDAHFKQVEPLHRQLRAKHAELEVLHYSDSKDDAKAQKIFRDMADIKAKLYSANNEYRARCKAKGFMRGGYHGDYRGDYQGHWGDGPRHGWKGDGQRGHRGGSRHHNGRGGW